ncbi:MAG TPA: UDP-3-O-(3-hydroxymyristoyl)glucosamine N-acyltransferase [Tepidisphaeraceae bacterium]|jgi:UDP-3-O-[3-hydroxymyristoyl] glucosamine N-acyltransferase|nr:UDP-3-O-(3-hydroxymyristoyl)glucosamine N-acyltransferase [Tepidisphaeraceae bacterium]
MPTLREIAALLNVEAPSGQDVFISGIAALSEATGAEMSYVGNDAFARELGTCNAAALIVQENVKLPATWTRPVLRVKDAELAVAKVLEMVAPPFQRPPVGVDPMARIDPSAILGERVTIAPFVYVGRRVRIGAGTILHPGVYIGDDTTLGDDCEIYPNVTIRERITIGSRVILNAGVVIGTDGFGYRWDGTKHAKIPQVGVVIIEDDVEIGSNSCVDRAKFSTTRIGRGSKIDNLVQVGHNVQMGPHCILAGQVGLAGTSKLGMGAVMGGQSSVRDHITVGAGAMIAGASGVAEDVPPGQIYSGTPAIPHRQSLREQKAMRRLPDLIVQLRELQHQVDAMKKKLGEGE